MGRNQNQEVDENSDFLVEGKTEEQKEKNGNAQRQEGEASGSALAACGAGRQDGCRGHSTQPNMVIRTQQCPTFSNGLNQSQGEVGRTIYGRWAAALLLSL